MTGDSADSTRLAVDRTRLAYERTLMAWVRTATSLISFGFTIYKFFQFLREGQPPPQQEGILGLRAFALLMITIGLTALLLAAADHQRQRHILRAEYGPIPYSLAAIVASLVGMLGVLSLAGVLTGAW
jgi:putative membrane protein